MIDYDLEKLDELPRREKIRRTDDRIEDRDGKIRQRVIKFLRGQVGKHVKNVYSRFMQLNWLPAEYKNYQRFSSLVEMNTFVGQDSFDKYYSKKKNKSITSIYVDNNRPHPAEYEMFFVNPKNGNLCHGKNK